MEECLDLQEKLLFYCDQGKGGPKFWEIVPFRKGFLSYCVQDLVF